MPKSYDVVAFEWKERFMFDIDEIVTVEDGSSIEETISRLIAEGFPKGCRDHVWFGLVEVGRQPYSKSTKFNFDLEDRYELDAVWCSFNHTIWVGKDIPKKFAHSNQRVINSKTDTNFFL